MYETQIVVMSENSKPEFPLDLLPPGVSRLQTVVVWRNNEAQRIICDSCDYFTAPLNDNKDVDFDDIYKKIVEEAGSDKEACIMLTHDRKQFCAVAFPNRTSND